MLAGVATGCGGRADRLPGDVHWSSDHFDYYLRAGDSSACRSVTETLERHREAVIGYLGLSDSDVRIEYRKFKDARDYVSSSSCPESGACATDQRIETPWVLDEHELIHAYLRQLGHPPALFAEGVAQALSCSGLPSERPDAIPDWRDEIARGPAKGIYPAAKWFVGYLLHAFGPKPFVELYTGDWSKANADEVAARFESEYERPLDAIWSAAFSSIQDTDICVHAWECAAEPAQVDGSELDLRVRCDGSGSYQTVTGEGTLLRLEDANGIVLSACSGSGPSVAPSVTADEMLVELGAGQIYLADSSGMARARASLLPALPESPLCTAVPFPWPAGPELKSWTIALRVRSTPVVLSLSRAQHAKLTVGPYSAATVDACSDCSAVDCVALGPTWKERTTGALRIAWPAGSGPQFDDVSIGALGIAVP